MTGFFEPGTRDWQARLAVSVDFMRDLSQVTDGKEMYAAFASRMNTLFPTNRQITLSRRGVEPPNFRVTRYNLWNEVPDPFSVTRDYPTYRGGLFADLLYADEPRLIDDLHLDEGDPSAEYLDGQHSLLCLPIFERGSAQHAIVVTREEAGAFSAEQVPELVLMTNLFGRATQTQVLSQALKSTYEDADAEIQSIAELQESLLPKSAPALSGLDSAVHYKAARRAGGDYYDFFPLPDGSLGVLIADVSGHGAAAAVVMAIAHSFAHSSEAPTHNPGEFLTYMNRRLSGAHHKASGTFITAFYSVIDPIHRVIRYASAGHVPPWLAKEDGRLLILNRVQRLPLGIGIDDYPQHESPFVPGDTIVAVTDGVTEAVDASGGVFGTERMHMLLKRPSACTSDLLIRILSALDQFTRRAPQTDDRTVVIVRSTS